MDEPIDLELVDGVYQPKGSLHKGIRVREHPQTRPRKPPEEEFLDGFKQVVHIADKLEKIARGVLGDVRRSNRRRF